MIDSNHSRGQTRDVDPQHVKFLAKEFFKNKPDRLTACVWYEQGSPSLSFMRKLSFMKSCNTYINFSYFVAQCAYAQ